MIRVALADDHPVVRAGLAGVIGGLDDAEVVASFGSAEELLLWLNGSTCDLVLLDLQFGESRMGGVAATRRIVADGGPRVLILTTYGTDLDIVAAVEAGATGYLLKDAPSEELAAGIRAAAAGRTALAPEVQHRLLERLRDPLVSLSARELEVLNLVEAGASNSAIARELVVTLATVKSHLAHIYTKLDVQSRTEAVAAARARGLLSR